MSLFLCFLLMMAAGDPQPARPAVRVEVTRWTQAAGQRVQKTFFFRVGETGTGEHAPVDVAPAGGPHRDLVRVVSACGPALAEDGDSFLSVRVHAYVYDHPRDLRFEVGVFNDRLQRAQGDVVASWKIYVLGKLQVDRGPTRLYDSTGRWEIPLGPLRFAPHDRRFLEYAREVPELPLGDLDLERILGQKPTAASALGGLPGGADALACDRELPVPGLVLFTGGANHGQELYLSGLKQKQEKASVYTLLEPALAPIRPRDPFLARDAEDPDPTLTGSFARNGFWSQRANAIVLRIDRAHEIAADLLRFVYVQARRPYHYEDDAGEVFRFDREYPVDPLFDDGTPRQPLFEGGRPQIRPYRETFGRASYASVHDPWSGYIEGRIAVQDHACAIIATGSEAARYELECILETVAASATMAPYPKGPCVSEQDAAWLLEGFDFAHLALDQPRYVKLADAIVQALDEQRGENYIVQHPEEGNLKEPYVNSVDSGLLIGALYRHWRWGGNRRALGIATAFIPAWLKYSPLTTDDNGDGDPDRLTGWKALWSTTHPSRAFVGTNPLAVGPQVLLALQYAADFTDDPRAKWTRDRLIEILLRTHVGEEPGLAPASPTTHAWACWALKNYAKRFTIKK